MGEKEQEKTINPSEIKWSKEGIKGKILHKLLRKGKGLHGHTPFENVQKGFPSHLGKEVKDCAKELVREGILFIKKASYGEGVLINTRERDRINYYISIFLNKKEVKF
jgi:hypothetical protein